MSLILLSILNGSYYLRSSKPSPCCLDKWSVHMEDERLQFSKTRGRSRNPTSRTNQYEFAGTLYVLKYAAHGVVKNPLLLFHGGCGCISQRRSTQTSRPTAPLTPASPWRSPYVSKHELKILDLPWNPVPMPDTASLVLGRAVICNECESPSP